MGVEVIPLENMRSGDLKPLLLLLMGAVGLILPIACSNLAALLLARNTARQREVAMRKALGAGRAALVRQVLAEMLVLSVMGSGLGLGECAGFRGDDGEGDGPPGNLSVGKEISFKRTAFASKAQAKEGDCREVHADKQEVRCA